jgi:hypothetical protein
MTARPYAADTSVPVSRSRAELEDTITKYGATGFMSGWDRAGRSAFVYFVMCGRHVYFRLPMPYPDDKQFWQTPSRGTKRSTEQARKAYDQECRRRWRALVLVIKAKLEAVETGIVEFEDEFMAHIRLPDGSTVGERMKPQIASAYEDGDMPLGLPDYSGGRP